MSSLGSHLTLSAVFACALIHVGFGLVGAEAVFDKVAGYLSDNIFAPAAAGIAAAMASPQP